jgi:hypothetical protein
LQARNVNGKGEPAVAHREWCVIVHFADDPMVPFDQRFAVNAGGLGRMNWKQRREACQASCGCTETQPEPEVWALWGL